jgi:hypothetical protein
LGGAWGVVRATRKPQMRVSVSTPLVEAEVGAEGGLVGQWDAWIGGVPSPPTTGGRMPRPLVSVGDGRDRLNFGRPGSVRDAAPPGFDEIE